MAVAKAQDRYAVRSPGGVTPRECATTTTGTRRTAAPAKPSRTVRRSTRGPEQRPTETATSSAANANPAGTDVGPEAPDNATRTTTAPANTTSSSPGSAA